MSTPDKIVDAASSKKMVTKVGTIKSMPIPVLAWKLVYSRLFFQPPEYNLAEVGRVEDVESYVRQAFRKKNGLMFKAGYTLTGPNRKTIEYVKKRFDQIEQAQGKPMEILFREVASDLLKFHNAYLVKVRSQKASGGIKRKDFRWGKTLQPVAGYFRLSPETVNIKRDIFGNVLQYRQQTYAGFKRIFFDPEDVIHFYVDRKGGFSVGTPALVPVMDDIRALRRLEENVELLVYQHLFPLLHYKVGTEEHPAQTYSDGSSEIDVVRTELEKMPAEGSIVTPERHEIRVVGAEGRALRVDWYLTHFRNRVFAGLGMSSMDFGEAGGANRSTAEKLSRSLIDDVKDYQCHLSAFINFEIIRELLLESTWGYDAIEHDNLVKFTFTEIDEDARVKREANALSMYQGNLLTETEARRTIGRQPFTEEDRDDIYFELVEKPKLYIQASHGISDGPVEMVGGGGGNGTSTTATIKPIKEPSATPAAKKAKNITQPANQYGKKPGPERKMSSEDPEAALKRLLFSENTPAKDRADAASRYDGEKTAVNLYTMYLSNVTSTIIREGKLDKSWMRQLSHATASRLNRSYFGLLQQHFNTGLKEKSYQSDPQILVAFNDLQRNCEQHVDQMLSNAENRITKTFSENDDVETRKIELRNLVESLEHRARFFHDVVSRRAHLWGKAHSLKLDGYKTLEVYTDAMVPGCQDCVSRGAQLIDTNSMSIRDIPPYHSSCVCDIQPQQE